VLYGYALCLPSGATGQGATNPSPASDSKSTLLEAAAANGAPSAQAKPWHAKISFTLYDWDGKPELQGAVEEFWAAQDKYKLVYTTSVFNQVEYTTPGGVRRTGSPDSAPPEITNIVDQFLRPIRLDQTSIEAAKLQIHDLKLGSITLVCVTATSNEPSNFDSPFNTTYCISDSAPVLRFCGLPSEAPTDSREQPSTASSDSRTTTFHKRWTANWPIPTERAEHNLRQNWKRWSSWNQRTTPFSRRLPLLHLHRR
jgi:hypothetical protein